MAGIHAHCQVKLLRELPGTLLGLAWPTLLSSLWLRR